MVHWFHGTYITPINGLKTFYTDIKTIEHVEKQAVSKKDFMRFLRVNNPKTTRIKNAQFSRYYFYLWAS